MLKKQREHAESKKLGRTENYCEYDSKTDRFEMGQRRADAKTKPPLVMQFETPIGRKRGVCKPE